MMRSAMSMLELVFAIVIMGIAVMSLPLILTQVQTNNAFAMQQEAILAAKTTIGDILTYEWDDKSYDANASRSFVLTTNSTTTALNCSATTFRRVGHVNADYRRKCSPLGATASTVATLGADGGDLDDIDDFNGKNIPIVTNIVEGAGSLDYVFTSLTLTPTITYASNAPINSYNNSVLTFTFNPDNANDITNIKTILVQVTGASQTITLRAFSCNVGESTLLPSRPYL